MADKRTTVDAIVSELRSGMTIGIGGWGSRRKPMAAVRAICRSDLSDLTVVAYGGPDVGLLCATGKVRKVVCGVRHPGLHRARSALARGAATRAGRGDRGRRGHVLLGPPGGGVARPVPSHPGRTGLRRAAHQPGPAPGAVALRCRQPVPLGCGRRRRGAGRHARAAPRRGDRPHQSRRLGRQRTGAGPRPVLRHALPRRGGAPVPHHRAHRGGGRPGRRRRPPALQCAHPPHAHRRRRAGSERRTLHRQPARLRTRRGVPEGVRGGGRRPGRVGGLRRPLRDGRRGRVPGAVRERGSR